MPDFGRTNSAEPIVDEESLFSDKQGDLTDVEMMIAQSYGFARMLSEDGWNQFHRYIVGELIPSFQQEMEVADPYKNPLVFAEARGAIRVLRRLINEPVLRSLPETRKTLGEERGRLRNLLDKMKLKKDK